jgi:hypothetical protein
MHEEMINAHRNLSRKTEEKIPIGNLNMEG